MKKFSFRRSGISARILIKYLALIAGMVVLNFALPYREPVAFALFFAAAMNGLNIFVCAAGYLLSSAAALSLTATLSSLVQAAFLVVVIAVYTRLGRKLRWERALISAIAQLPFIFLFPHPGYGLLSLPPLAERAVIAVFFFLLALLFDGALHALLTRAFRCRLPAGNLAEICLLWVFLGLGMLSAFGSIAFYAVSLTALLLGVVLLRTAASVPFAVVLSVPLCLVQRSAVPLAEYAAFSSLALLLSSYGRVSASLALFLSFLAAQYFHGLYARGVWEIVLTLLSCLLPALVAVGIPDKWYKKAKNTLLFYRERTLPRIAINHNRRAVGEQLYEVSSLFREIETAFDFQETDDRMGDALREKLVSSLCAGCNARRRCEEAHIRESLDKLIAVGRAKGKVNLIDLPADISSLCGNAAGLLFALNKHLTDYRRYSTELQAAREGRRLLAEQAHGVSEILRNIALEQSEEFSFSDEESAVARALSAAGILSSEIFVYGEGGNMTVSMTLESAVSGNRLAEIAGRALKAPLTLAEKIPLTADCSCYIFKRKAAYDAAFGVASCPKKGQQASGDTHSIMKIDERRFLVALSDGMGSGEEARTVSDHTLSLLESFYKAKMPSETVLGTVNKLIAFSAQESFSCLDLAAVNLDTGCADVVKIGSPTGFILSGEELKMLEGASLPIGMLEAVHPATMRVEMKADDFLIFMSDGVTTAFGSSAELCAYLSNLRPLNPQSLAEEIMKNALERYGGTAEDDMTVLTVKLTRAA